MKNFLLTIFSFAALSACGQLNSAKITPPGSGAKTQAITMSTAQFQSQCQNVNGVISTDGMMCLGRVQQSITAGQTGSIPIDNNFANGNYIVASGTGSVSITLNGRYVASINSRLMLVAGNGQLAFNVTSASATGSAIVYHCYDRNMTAVYCNDGVIPK